MLPASFSIEIETHPFFMTPAKARRCGFAQKIVLGAASAFLACLGISSTARAAWQPVLIEQGKRVEIERDSIVSEPGGKYRAKSQTLFDKPITDPRTTAAYRRIEITHSFDCAERTRATLSRTYYRENGDLLNQEDVKNPFYMIVKPGTSDERLLRIVCQRNNSGQEKPVEFSGISSEILARLRQHNEALLQQEREQKKGKQHPLPRTNIRISSHTWETEYRAGGSKKSKSTSASRGMENATSAAEKSPPNWSYTGEKDGPDRWGLLHPAYALCSSGKRQSPIDIQDTLALDLEPFSADYAPAMMSVVDTQKNLLLRVFGGGMIFQGKKYALKQIRFHHPAETRVRGKAFDMEAHLVHQDDNGKEAVVSILFEKGQENPVIQQALNYLPLERGGELTPQDVLIDIERLLPQDRRYFAFMGSLSSPPCTEEVVWIVFRQPQGVSPEQLAIFERMYGPNARPVQPAFDRVIKESR